MRQLRAVLWTMFVLPLVGLGVMACAPDPAIPSDTTLAPPTTPTTAPPTSLPPGPPLAGCYDSVQAGIPDVVFSGVIGGYKSFKNLHLFLSQNGTCTGVYNQYVTLVQAPDLGTAYATCQAGPNPAVSSVLNLSASGFTSMPQNAWICEDVLFLNGLLEPNTCYFPDAFPGDFLKFEQRNSIDNLALLSSGTGCTGAVQQRWTVVEQTSAAAALGLCRDIDPGFTSASPFPLIGWQIPDDIWICNT